MSEVDTLGDIVLEVGAALLDKLLLAGVDVGKRVDGLSCPVGLYVTLEKAWERD